MTIISYDELGELSHELQGRSRELSGCINATDSTMDWLISAWDNDTARGFRSSYLKLRPTLLEICGNLKEMAAAVDSLIKVCKNLP